MVQVQAVLLGCWVTSRLWRSCWAIQGCYQVLQQQQLEVVVELYLGYLVEM
jgi:hypothetical protein